ncbi:DUF3253 domain-containing protein [Egicoccus halophilus]|uniref:S-adenosylmethionine tRNA ribosyltransferase n=1 Tax=Egicoccus halophilus TaxID=1670830 RepID=A0A8J3ET73_9ACTN|nr:DUF3253 domain-containing protein [Egicoccus halophilus]GGI03345.1 hypothetical protein GCM10011354_03570 [Egicoccus halophilus]
MSDPGGQLEAAILALLARRAPQATICPSEAARAVAGDDGDWRARMPAARDAAARLADAGEIRVLQGGATVDVRTARGPVRLGREPRED